jgi:hypothetical protein
MRLSNVFGISIFLFAWSLWLYQLKTGKMLNRNWQVWTTLRERPAWYWIHIVLFGLTLLFFSIAFIRDGTH